MERQMNVTMEDLEVEVVESTADNEDDFGGRYGWFWLATSYPARGPFGSAPEAVRDLADWIERREGPAAQTTDLVLARTFLKNAEGFLEAAQAAPAGAMSEVALTMGCHALELVLKAYLLSRGRSDDWNRDNIRHDLGAALAEATHLGMPSDDARIGRFIKVVGGPFARHELIHLAADPPPELATIGYLIAIRSLHKGVARGLVS